MTPRSGSAELRTSEMHSEDDPRVLVRNGGSGFGRAPVVDEGRQHNSLLNPSATALTVRPYEFHEPGALAYAGPLRLDISKSL